MVNKIFEYWRQKEQEKCLNAFYSLNEAKQVKILQSCKLSTLPNLLNFLKNKTNKKIMSDMTCEKTKQDETIDEFYSAYNQPNYQETLDQSSLQYIL